MTPGESRRRTVGVVLAGGVGTRVGSTMPKQLLEIAGTSIIERTLAVFETTAEVDDVLVMMAPGYVAEVAAMVEARGLGKVRAVLAGGVTRNDTTQLALDWLGDEECNVLFHDAVRPFVSSEILRECASALQTVSAVAVAIPSVDTILVVEGEVITEIPDRDRLRRAQTPQGFRLSVIREAYRVAWQDPDFIATDDASVVLRYLPEVAIRVVDGSERNVKVTTPLDVVIAEMLAATP